MPRLLGEDSRVYRGGTVSEVVERLERVIADIDWLVQQPGYEVAAEVEEHREIMDAILDCYLITRGLDVRPTRRT